ncbi:HNH endonuclease [Deinococcus sp.]|uniref:HNH endonuclease n=1 Tax=Deinococcus sp. TaxID=47478 RepID=UPI003C7BDBF8
MNYSLVDALENGEIIYKSGKTSQEEILQYKRATIITPVDLSIPYAEADKIPRRLKGDRKIDKTFWVKDSVQAHWIVWIKFNGIMGENYEIHHKRDKHDNSLTNLQKITKSEHAALTHNLNKIEEKLNVEQIFALEALLRCFPNIKIKGLAASIGCQSRQISFLSENLSL